MKKLIIGLLLLIGFNGWGQVSVFDCNSYKKTLHQTELNADTNFYNTCYEMGIESSVALQGDAHKIIKASTQIHLKDSVHFGAFTNEGQAHLLISDTTDFDVVAMNYDSLDAVLRYKKLELGIPLPDDIADKVSNFINDTGPDSLQLNPFLEWDIDVKASFYTEDWGETINGFYTREYQQNAQTHDWDDIGTDYPFRIRFAPPRNGEWWANVVIKVNGQVAYKSNFFFFNVIESGHPGYVKVHENNRNLKRGDRMIFPVGQNFPSPGGSSGQFCGGNYENIVPNTESCTNTETWNIFLDEVETYFTLGNQYGDPNKPNFIRFVAMPWASAIEYEEKGNYYNRLHYASEIDKLIDLCEEYDGLMIYDLMYQAQFMYRNYTWQWSWEHIDEDGNHLNEYGPNSDYPFYCYNDAPGPGGKKPHEMFTNSNDLAYHKQRTRYIIARYGYSTQIYEWELLSEPWHLDERPEAENSPFQNPNHSDHSAVKNAVENYHKVISSYIKDTLNRNQQLVGIDMGYHDGTFDEQSVLLENIDIVGFNPYYTSPNALIESLNYKPKTMFNYVHKIWDKRDSIGLDYVPVIIPEGGIDNSYSECSNFDLRPVDEMTLGFTGVAGFHFWDGSGLKADGTYYTELWKNTFRAQNHFNGDDVIGVLSDGGGYWSHGMGIEKLKDNNYNDVEAVEMQAYISNNKNLAVGYVRNRTFNLFTQGSGISPCSDVVYEDTLKVALFSPINNDLNFQWDDIEPFNRIKIEGLKKAKTYNVDFYGDLNGSIQYIFTDNKLSSASGKLKLRYPELYIEESWQNRSIVWFVAKREGYNGMMQNDEITQDSSGVFSKELLTNEQDTLSQRNKLSVYPNPFEDYFIIKNPVNDKIVIQEPSGRLVLQQEVSKGENIIRTERLKNGIYFVRFVGQSRTFKIVKL